MSTLASLEKVMESNIRMIGAARSILLAATNPSETLYARMLWRAAELRYVLYQICLGDVLVTREDPVLKATTRAAQQLCEKLAKDTCGIAPAPLDLVTSETDQLVVALDTLSRQLCGILFETNPERQIPLKLSTVKDWYIKLTFIITTLQKPSVTKRMTTIEIPDEDVDANYEQLEETQLLKSIRIIRIKLESALVVTSAIDASEHNEYAREDDKKGTSEDIGDNNDLEIKKKLENSVVQPIVPVVKMSYAAAVKRGL